MTESLNPDSNEALAKGCENMRDSYSLLPTAQEAEDRMAEVLKGFAMLPNKKAGDSELSKENEATH